MTDKPIEMSVSSYRATMPMNQEMQNFLLGKISAGTVEGETSGPAEVLLILDCSYSMYEKGPGGVTHIEKLVDAVKEMIAALRPDDRLGIVAFETKSWLVCPLVLGKNREQLMRDVDSIIEEGGGGTRLKPGLETAIKEIRSNSDDPRAVRLIVLTDGQASDEDEVLAYLPKLDRQNIASLGFGQFDFEFMNKVCSPSKGLCQEVGGEDPSMIGEILLNELKIAQDTVATNLRVRLEVYDRVIMRNAYIAHPNPTYLGKIELDNNRCWEAALPVLERSQGMEVLLDLIHEPRDAGRHEAGKLSLAYDIPAHKLKDQTIETPIVIEYTEDPMRLRDVNAHIKDQYNRVKDEELRFCAQEAEEMGDLQTRDYYLDLLGKRTKDEALATMIATQQRPDLSPDERRELSKRITQKTRSRKE